MRRSSGTVVGDSHAIGHIVRLDRLGVLIEGLGWATTFALPTLGIREQGRGDTESRRRRTYSDSHTSSHCLVAKYA